MFLFGLMTRLFQGQKLNQILKERKLRAPGLLKKKQQTVSENEKK